MPYRSFGKEVTRSTVTKDRWTVTLVLACADIIAAGAQTPAFISITWRKEQEDTGDQPEDTRPVEVQLRKRSEASNGEIHFYETEDATRIQFQQVNETRFVALEGVSGSTGNEPDVEMVFHIDGEEREIIPLRCGSPPTTITIGLADEEAELPDLLVPEVQSQLMARIEPTTEGAYHWISFEPERITLDSGANNQTVTLTAHEVNAESPWVSLMVLFAPTEGPAVVATSRFEIVDLAQNFENRLLHRRHLGSEEYRVQLESLAPADVQAFINNADAAGLDTAMRDYLDRLLIFAQTQAPLREAPVENRHNITFIMGRTQWTERRTAENRSRADGFYRYATSYYTAVPDGRLVTPDDMGVPNTPSTYNPHASIADVLDYLRNNPPPNGGRWGRINIVSHADELGGMFAFTTQPQAGDDYREFRVNLTTLRAARAAGGLDSIEDERVDVRTEIQIRGCALGRTPDALDELSLIFGGDDQQRPQAFAPVHIQVFEGPSGWSTNDPIPGADQVDNFYNEFFLVNVPEADLPANARQLEPRFQVDFPHVQINWHAALGHQGSPAGDSPAYERRQRTYTYTIPFWPDPGTSGANRTSLVQNAVPGSDDATSVVETDRNVNDDGTIELSLEWQEPDQPGATLNSTITVGQPQFANDQRRDGWLDDQGGLVNALGNMEFEHGDFTWHFRTEPGTNPDGTRSFESRGVRYIYRVERELREPDPANAGSTIRQRPVHTDEDHFGAEIPVSPPEHPLGQNVEWEED